MTVTVTVIVTVTMSLKSTDHKAHTYLLRKLQKKGMGVNEVEMLAKKSSGMEPRKEEKDCPAGDEREVGERHPGAQVEQGER